MKISKKEAERRTANYKAVSDSIGDAPQYIYDWMQLAIDKIGYSQHERSIAELMLKGYPTREIAELMGNSEKTIKHHIHTIFLKAGVNSRGELFALVFGLA